MTETKNIKTAIIGASGYTGVELIRLLYQHPNVEIAALVANSQAGKGASEVFSHLGSFQIPDLVTLDQVDFSDIDVVFCCLPHATSQEVILSLPDHVKVIDLSADFRIKDPEVYEQWYGHEHKALELQKDAVYGLTEFYRKEVAKARLVACPGCYPTCATLPLIPLVKAGIVNPEQIIIDAKSGYSGAGRSVRQNSLYCEVNESVKAYGICQHRHTPEMEQVLTEQAGQSVAVSFVPQVVPLNRGMMATIYVNLEGATAEKAHEVLSEQYQDEAFVYVLPFGEVPTIRDVYSTNNTRIGVAKGRHENQLVLVSVIDNLVKGASGQAVQNMNCMFGLDEITGLDMVPVFP